MIKAVGGGCLAKSCLTIFVTHWTVACQAPLSMGFPRQEYWSGLPFPSPGDFPNPRMEHASLVLAGRFFTTESPEKPQVFGNELKKQVTRPNGWESQKESKQGVIVVRDENSVLKAQKSRIYEIETGNR